MKDKYKKSFIEMTIFFTLSAILNVAFVSIIILETNTNQEYEQHLQKKITDLEKDLKEKKEALFVSNDQLNMINARNEGIEYQNKN